MASVSRYRYYIALFPSGWFEVHRAPAHEVIRFAYTAGRGVEVGFVADRGDIPAGAGAIVAAREITALDARQVMACRSPLVPVCAYAAKLGFAAEAALQAAERYRIENDDAQAEIVGQRASRLFRRIRALHLILLQAGLNPWQDIAPWHQDEEPTWRQGGGSSPPHSPPAMLS